MFVVSVYVPNIKIPIIVFHFGVREAKGRQTEEYTETEIESVNGMKR